MATRRAAKTAGARGAEPASLPVGEVTRRRILDAAEKLFADHGYANVSVREVTTKARQNLSAVNYHFGSKDGLLEAVYLRRGHMLNEERLSLLGEAEEAAPDGIAPLEMVLRAMLLPGIRWSIDRRSGRATFIRFLFRSYHDSTSALKQLRLREAEILRQMMLPRLRRVLPGMSEVDLRWGIQFALGAMHYTIGDLKWSKAVAGNTLDEFDIDRVTNRLITFTAGGIRQLAAEALRGYASSAGPPYRVDSPLPTFSELE